MAMVLVITVLVSGRHFVEKRCLLSVLLHCAHHLLPLNIFLQPFYASTHKPRDHGVVQTRLLQGRMHRSGLCTGERFHSYTCFFRKKMTLSLIYVTGTITKKSQCTCIDHFLSLNSFFLYATTNI